MGNNGGVMSRAPTTVVMLHGQPGAPLDWHAVTSRLPNSLIPFVVDRPGYGRSPHGPGGLADNADALARELDERSVESAIIAGHSWGGGAALAMAVRHPDRVKALVLAASIGPDCLARLDYALAAPVLGQAMAFATFKLAGPVIRRRVRKRVAGGGLDDITRREVEVRLVANQRRKIWRTFLVEQRAMLDELPALCSALTGLDVPTVVLAGAADKVVPLRTAEALAGMIPRADLRIIESAKHYLPRFHADDVASAIIDVAARAASHA